MLISRKSFCIIRLKLTQRRVKKTASENGTVLNKRKMRRRKYNRVKLAYQFSRTFEFNPVFEGGALLINYKLRRLLTAVCKKFNFIFCIFLFKAEKLAVLLCTEALAAREHPDTFKQIGLALGIFAENDINSVGRINFYIIYIPVISHRQ